MYGRYCEGGRLPTKDKRACKTLSFLYFNVEIKIRNILYMRSLLGWLETRLAQITRNYLKLALSLFIVKGNLSYLKLIYIF